MTVNEFIEYLIEEVASGRINGDDILCHEQAEECCVVEDVYTMSPGYVHTRGGDNI